MPEAILLFFILQELSERLLDSFLDGLSGALLLSESSSGRSSLLLVLVLLLGGVQLRSSELLRLLAHSISLGLERVRLSLDGFALGLSGFVSSVLLLKGSGTLQFILISLSGSFSLLGVYESLNARDLLRVGKSGGILTSSNLGQLSNVSLLEQLLLRLLGVILSTAV